MIPKAAGWASAVNGVSVMFDAMIAANSRGPIVFNCFFILPPAMTEGPKGLIEIALWSCSHRSLCLYIGKILGHEPDFYQSANRGNPIWF